MVSLSYGIFFGCFGNGGGTGGKQTSCTLFQFVADSVDDNNRHYYDCNGTRKHFRRKECRQKSKSRQTLCKNFTCVRMDSSYSFFGKIRHTGSVCTACRDGKHKLSHMGGIFHLYDSFCVSLVSARNSHTVACQVHG